MIIPFWVVFGGIIAALAWNLAAKKHKDSLLWAVICFIIPIAIIFLLASGSNDEVEAASSVRDLRRWNALIEVDPDIAAAAEKARSLDPDCERLLAEKYMVLNDKQYLEPLLTKVITQFEADTDSGLADERYDELERLKWELSVGNRN
jgi:hypothetical protein